MMPIPIQGKGLGIAFNLKEDPNLTDDKGNPLKGYAQLKKCLENVDGNGGKLSENDVFYKNRVKEDQYRFFSFEIPGLAIDENKPDVDLHELFFFSPNVDPSGVTNTAHKVDPQPISADSNFQSCFIAEKHSEEGYVVHKNELISEAYDACSKDDLKKMLDAYKSLNSDIAGNLVDAVTLAQRALGFAMEKQLDENLEKMLAKLTEQANALNEVRKDKDTDRPGARRALREYTEVLKELETKVLKPAKEELEILFAEMDKDNLSQERKNDIKERIDRLKEVIKEYGRRKDSTVYGTKHALSLAKKFALETQAEKIMEVVLLSSELGNVKKSRDIPKVSENIRKKVEKFRKTDARRWRDSYERRRDAEDGDYTPSQRAGAQADRYRNRKEQRYKSYMQQEQKYAQFCQPGVFGVQNPVRCKRYMSPQAIERRRQAYINGRKKDYQGELYYRNQAQEFYDIAYKARSEEEGWYDGDGFFDDYGFSDYDGYGNDYFSGGNPFAGPNYNQYQQPFNPAVTQFPQPYNLNGQSRYPAQQQFPQQQFQMMPAQQFPTMQQQQYQVPMR